MQLQLPIKGKKFEYSQTFATINRPFELNGGWQYIALGHSSSDEEEEHGTEEDEESSHEREDDDEESSLEKDEDEEDESQNESHVASEQLLAFIKIKQ